MMLNQPGEGTEIRSELFELSRDQLPKLDELEYVGQEGSCRSDIEVMALGGGQPQTAIGFFKSEQWLEPLHSDCIADYRDRRFIPPWDRLGVANATSTRRFSNQP